MGELVVVATRMDVESLAQVLHGHRRALDVPTGEAFSPRARPLHAPAWTGLLPQSEVGRMALVRIDLDLLPMARAQRVERIAGELPVLRERRNVEVHGSVDLVGVSPLDQSLDDGNHLGDVVGGTGVR